MPDDKDEDDLYDAVSAMADRLDLQGKERSQYIHEHMTRGGYRAVPNYVREDQEDDDRDRSQGSRFFSGRDREERRPRGRDDRGSRRDRGNDNWYD